MKTTKDLVGYYYTKIVKSLKYLNYSYDKVKKLPTHPNQLSDSELELWDGFSTRFARSSDLFLSKYIKAYILADDPAFDGKFRDLLNKAEKYKLIESSIPWIEIRELRNIVVHEYSDEDLDKILQKMVKLTPLILELEKRLSV